MRCHTPTNRRNRLVPQVEALESRQLLSGSPAFVINRHPLLGVTAQVRNGNLTIRGTDNNDRIQINDDGTRVHVFAVFPSGASYNDLGVFTNVRNINVDTRGGNDLVKYA